MRCDKCKWWKRGWTMYAKKHARTLQDYGECDGIKQTGITYEVGGSPISVWFSIADDVRVVTKEDAFCASFVEKNGSETNN